MLSKKLFMNNLAKLISPNPVYTRYTYGLVPIEKKKKKVAIISVQIDSNCISPSVEKFVKKNPTKNEANAERTNAVNA
jgi:hypothetical protein